MDESEGATIAKAYGLLYLFEGDARYLSDRRVFAARKLLLSLLTKDGQASGITAAQRDLCMSDGAA